MTRRPILPGASELFRRTDTPSVPEVTELPSLSSTTSSPALRGSAAARRSEEPAEAQSAMPLTLVPGGAAERADDLASFRTPAPAAAPVAPPAPVMQPRIPTRGRPTKRTERTKHDEKITVYISADDLVALESARLSLRAQHDSLATETQVVRSGARNESPPPSSSPR